MIGQGVQEHPLPIDLGNLIDHLGGIVVLNVVHRHHIPDQRLPPSTTDALGGQQDDLLVGHGGKGMELHGLPGIHERRFAVDEVQLSIPVAVDCYCVVGRGLRLFAAA